MSIRENLPQESAEAAIATGARGLVVAHWAGTPALAPLASALPGWVLAAGLSWGLQSKVDDLADALTLHVLEDKMGRAGKVLLELGKAEMSLSLPSPEPSLQPSLLLSLVMRPNAVTHLEGLDADKISRSVGEIRYIVQAYPIDTCLDLVLSSQGGLWQPWP